jgi:acetyl esterase/lipase
MEGVSAAELLDCLKKRNLLRGLSLAELRQVLAALYHGFDAEPGPQIKPTAAPEPPGIWIEAGPVQPVRPGRLVLFFHGGGFTVGSARDHASLCGRLSRAAQSRILSSEYRLPPEHPFPVAVLDCYAAYRWLLSQGQPAGRTALAGISAGATLVLTTLILAKREGLALPAAAACMSPATDMRFPGASITGNAAGDWIIPERLAAIRQVYLGGHDPDDPLASPVRADLRGLPPLILQTGEGELLLDDNKTFAARLAEAGGEVDFQVWPGMFHCWQIFASVLAGGDEALDATGAFLDARLG